MKKVLAGGAFNSIHPGHEYFLNRALEYGDFLIVVIATDKTVKRNKNYLIKGQEERKKQVEKLGIASKVVIGDENDFMKTVEAETPDVVVLGYDQKLEEGLRNKIKKRGIKIVRIKDKYGDYSTSKSIGV